MADSRNYLSSTKSNKIRVLQKEYVVQGYINKYIGYKLYNAQGPKPSLALS